MSLNKKTKQWLKLCCPVSLKGKTVLITGANSGIGFKTAEISLYLGANVILACRSMEKASNAAEELLREYADGSVRVMKLDMASFASIDAFAGEIRGNAIDIDVFVNNAGVFRKPGRTTEDGFELVIGTNYIGVYYLTEHLLQYLAGLPHEVVYINTISLIHKIATVDYSDFYYAKHYGNFRVYARSKLCLAKYTYAMARKYEGSNLRFFMSHPGIAITPMGMNAYGDFVKKAAKVLSWVFNAPEKSSLSVAYILSHNVPAGSIVGPSRGFGGWGYPRKNRIYRRVKTGAEELIRFTNDEIKQRES